MEHMPAMGFSMDYIVRIYHASHRQKRAFVGVVEKIGEPGKHAFNTPDQLWEIMMEGRGRKAPGTPEEE